MKQQGKTAAELLKMWHERDYWTDVQGQAGEIDALIGEFSAEVGLLSRL